MKKILLFNPPSGLYRRDSRCQNRVEDQTVNVIFPPMELLYGAAVLEAAGHQVWVRDYPAQGSTWNNLIADLQEIRPDLVLFTVTQPTLATDLTAAAVVKEHLPQTRVAAKGEPLHFIDAEVIRNTPSLDVILRGEVESILPEFAQSENWEKIPGVTLMHSGQLIQTPLSSDLLDLNTLPFPARHLIDNRLYRSPETHNPLTTIVTSLGCPHQCIFCSVPAITGTKVRYRSPENIVVELEECVNRYGISEFLFHADTFTLHKNWVIDLCRRILQKGLNIRWGCNSRVDTLDEERLIWMKRAGCWVIGFGVESGNDQHLEKMKKRATGEQARQAVRLCRNHGIRSHAFFVFGFPWDTETSLHELLDFAQALDPDFFDFNVAYPLPGTELNRMVEEQGLIERDRLNQGGYAVGAVRTPTLSPEQLDQWRRRALWKMYLRPRYVWRTFRQAGSPAIAWNYFRAAVGRAKNLIRGKRNTRNIPAEDIPGGTAPIQTQLNHK